MNSITKLFHPKGLIMGCRGWCHGFMIFCLFFFTVVNGLITVLFVKFPIMLGCCFLGLLLLVDFILFCFNETTRWMEDGSVNQDKNIKICVILSISLFFLHIVLLVCRFYFVYRGKLQNVSLHLMRSSFLEYWIYGRYDLMSSVIVFIEIILLFVAAFVTHFYLQRWKQVITNDIISGIFRGIESIDSWEPTHRCLVFKLYLKRIESPPFQFYLNC